jgi:hypothetical protein
MAVVLFSRLCAAAAIDGTERQAGPYDLKVDVAAEVEDSRVFLSAR